MDIPKGQCCLLLKLISSLASPVTLVIKLSTERHDAISMTGDNSNYWATLIIEGKW